MRERPADFIESIATNPGGDLACDFEIANEKERSGLREDLERGLIRPVRDIAGGVEVTFLPEAWPTVQRYVNLEARCCSFRSLAAERRPDAVVLRVTGRPEAEAVIRSIFQPA